MANVLVDEEQLFALIKQNEEIKNDVIKLNAALAPVFSFVGASRPFSALTKAAKHFIQNPEGFKELGIKVGEFIHKYSPATLEKINKAQQPALQIEQNNGNGE